MGARFGNDFKRTSIFVGEFFGWSGGVEEFGFDEDLLSNRKQRWQRSSGIGRSLVVILCFKDGRLEFLVKFI